MARLNEATVPTESVDALKRRFIRQNRELAKNNSNQSVRIRNLETEQSRLVAENLALRERIIELEAQLDRSQNHHAVQNVGAVKDKLEAKIQELASMVAELGVTRKPESPKEEARLSPALAQWRNARLMDPLADEGRLPTIAEGKYYPRKTLDAEEIRRVSDLSSQESPDLGPPPVVRFSEEDPIKFDPAPHPSEFNAVPEDADSVPDAVSINVESRRRRRESKPEIRRMSVFQSPPEKAESEQNGSVVHPVLKAGAKRKLGSRDDDSEAASKGEEEGFRFSRRTTQQLQEAETEAEHVEKRDKDEVLSEAPKLKPNAPADRKVLGQKPINTDPVLSPRKVSKAAASDAKPEKPETKKAALPIREPKTGRLKERKTKAASTVPEPVISIPLPETVPVQLAELPPETPAGLDFFSPPTTNPSTARPITKDTPPPGELNPSTEEGAQPGGGRPGRRARAAVNYAEPSLISKMRRPTKELAPAVVEKSRPSSTEPPEKPAARGIVIKRERDEKDSAWKNLPIANGNGPEPNSPLLNKTSATKLPNGTTHDEDERPDEPSKPSASATAMADLMAAATSASRRNSRFPSHASRLAAAEKKDKDEENGEKRDSLAIFDFNESSPRDVSSSAEVNVKPVPSQAKASRRHSSMSQLNGAAPAGKSELNISRARSVRDARPVPEVKEVKVGESGTSRTDRAALRRKSMML